MVQLLFLALMGPIGINCSVPQAVVVEVDPGFPESNEFVRILETGGGMSHSSGAMPSS